MRTFYEAWGDYFNSVATATELPLDDSQEVIDALVLQNAIRQPMATELNIEAFLSISFTHHCEILVKAKNLDERIFYIHQTAINKWDKYKLRDLLKADLYHHQGTMPNNFTNTMFDYIKAVEEDEYMDQKAKYKESLRMEQKCWEEWVECRKEISQILTDEIKNAYDFSTNQMLRAKLYQLKNQNRDLGLTSGEIMKCALPENCSDKDLLEYPGFDKVWAKHCEDLDWYPKFD